MIQATIKNGHTTVVAQGSTLEIMAEVSEIISVIYQQLNDNSGKNAIREGYRQGLVRFLNAVMLAEYFSDTNEWALAHNPAVTVSVTHWMPLPEPPKMKGGAE